MRLLFLHDRPGARQVTDCFANDPDLVLPPATGAEQESSCGSEELWERRLGRALRPPLYFFERLHGRRLREYHDLDIRRNYPTWKCYFSRLVRARSAYLFATATPPSSTRPLPSASWPAAEQVASSPRRLARARDDHHHARLTLCNHLRHGPPAPGHTARRHLLRRLRSPAPQHPFNPHHSSDPDRIISRVELWCVWLLQRRGAMFGFPAGI